MPVIEDKTRGTSSRAINIDVQDGIVKSVQFVGGCAGNTAGISKLVEGMSVDEVISRMSQDLEREGE